MENIGPTYAELEEWRTVTLAYLVKRSKSRAGKATAYPQKMSRVDPTDEGKYQAVLPKQPLEEEKHAEATLRYLMRVKCNFLYILGCYNSTI